MLGMLGAYGNEEDMAQAIRVLRSVKDSIINIYQLRTQKERKLLADMMKQTTWMDANEACAFGFVDGIMTNPTTGIENAAFIRTANLEEAKSKYDEWHGRRRPIMRKNASALAVQVPDVPVDENTDPEGTPVEQLIRQLDAIRNW